MVQLREKDLPGGLLLKSAIDIREAIAGRALLIVNERVDVALAARSHGVQLGEEALPIGSVRQFAGSHVLIGRSVHSIESARQAVADGADFLVAGTMYATRSHPGAEPIGPSLVRNIARLQAGTSNPLPVIGIGGITVENVGEVMGAGASGVAVITSILASADPKAEATRLKNAMLGAWPDQPPFVSGISRPGNLEEVPTGIDKPNG
jgi:thiamine-phosphate diphosphorylase